MIQTFHLFYARIPECHPLTVAVRARHGLSTKETTATD
jgi:hypothetical protein